MGASVGGGPMGLLAMTLLSLIIVGVLFLYGAYLAYKGEKSKTSFGLLLGTSQILLSVLLYFVTAIVIYNSGSGVITQAFKALSVLMMALGLLLNATCFILYVKKYNQTLTR